MKGGRYIDDGQYDHHVWIYHIVQLLRLDMACYGTCFKLFTDEGEFIKRIDPREVIIHE